MTRPPATAGQAERRIDAAAEHLLGLAPADLPARMWDPQECPEEWLPRLAAIFLVPIFSSSWDVAEQRRVVEESITARRAGGTQAGLVAMLDAAGAVYDYREPDERPYEIEIDILNGGATTLPTPQIVEILQRQKRAAVKMTISVHAALDLEIPARAGLGGAVVAPELTGKL